MHGIDTIKKLNELQDQNGNTHIELTKADLYHKGRVSESTKAQDVALEKIKRNS